MKKTIYRILIVLIMLTLSSCSLNVNKESEPQSDNEKVEYIEVDYMKLDEKKLFGFTEDSDVQVLKRNEADQIIYYKVIENGDYIKIKEEYDEIIKLLDSGEDLSESGVHSLKDFWFSEEVPIEEVMLLDSE